MIASQSQLYNTKRLRKLSILSNPAIVFTKHKSQKLTLQAQSKSTHKKISFVFATGGAGFCISRALALKMLPIAANGKFINIGDKIGLPDDVTMGYIIEYLLNVPLTIIDTFHSHLEPMEFLRKDTFKDQVRTLISVIRTQHLIN